VSQRHYVNLTVKQSTSVHSEERKKERKKERNSYESDRLTILFRPNLDEGE